MRVQTIVLQVVLRYLANCQLVSLPEEILVCGFRNDLSRAHLLNELELLLVFQLLERFIRAVIQKKLSDFLHGLDICSVLPYQLILSGEALLVEMGGCHTNTVPLLEDWCERRGSCVAHRERPKRLLPLMSLGRITPLVYEDVVRDLMGIIMNLLRDVAFVHASILSLRFFSRGQSSILRAPNSSF